MYRFMDVRSQLFSVCWISVGRFKLPHHGFYQSLSHAWYLNHIGLITSSHLPTWILLEIHIDDLSDPTCAVRNSVWHQHQVDVSFVILWWTAILAHCAQDLYKLAQCGIWFSTLFTMNNVCIHNLHLYKHCIWIYIAQNLLIPLINS